MRRRWASTSFVLFGLLAGASHASAQTVTDHRVWFVMPMTGRIGSASSPWRWTFETILRSREGVDDLDSFTVRPIITFDLTPRTSVGGGYMRATAFLASGGSITENRVFGQFAWSSPLSGGTIALRTRMEGRFVEGNSGPAARLRQQVRFSRPIRSSSRVALVGYDEILIHLNSTTRAASGIEQNRAFVGVSGAITSAVRVEVGYLNQFFPGHRGTADRMNHVLMTTMGIAF